jgi:hypothetical protein
MGYGQDRGTWGWGGLCYLQSGPCPALLSVMDRGQVPHCYNSAFSKERNLDFFLNVKISKIITVGN